MRLCGARAVNTGVRRRLGSKATCWLRFVYSQDTCVRTAVVLYCPAGGFATLQHSCRSAVVHHPPGCGLTYLRCRRRPDLVWGVIVPGSFFRSLRCRLASVGQPLLHCLWVCVSWCLGPRLPSGGLSPRCSCDRYPDCPTTWVLILPCQNRCCIRFEGFCALLAVGVSCV